MLDSGVIRPRRGIGRMELAEGKPLKVQKTEMNEKSDDKTITCSENFRQYLLNSTLHGLRYVGETQISVFERYECILSLKCLCIKPEAIF